MLELIDFDVEEVFEDEDGILIYAPFEQFGAIQKYLEDPLAEEIIQSNLSEGDIINVDLDVKTSEILIKTGKKQKSTKKKKEDESTSSEEK